MAFSDAFARGYAIGDAAKKRKASEKFFERFKELTDEGDSEPVTEIGGVPVPNSAIPTSDGASALPVEAAGPADAALTVDAPEAIQVSAPKKIPLKQAEEVKKSLTRANIKELDSLAMEAARAAGDVEVYTALQNTTDRFLQGKVMKNMSLAQTAAQNGETDEVEKYLTRAYRFVPDGQEVKFTRKDGKLMVKNPWGDNDIELGSEQIGYIATMMTDPQKWSEIVREERKSRAKQATDDRQVDIAQQNADTAKAGLDIDRERVRVLQGELGLRGEELKLKKLMAPIERYTEFQKGGYYGALREQALADAKAGGKPTEFLDEAIKMSESVEKSMDSMVTPVKDALGQVDPNWQPNPEVMISDGKGGRKPLDGKAFNDAKGLAQTIAMANRGLVGNQVAQSAGLLLMKAQLDPDNFSVQIDASSGVMHVPFRGMNVPVKLPAELVQSLAEQQAASERKAGDPYFPEF